MKTVNIVPLPAWARATRFRPQHPPVFPDGPPTPEERELARELFQALDADSQEWYRRHGGFLDQPT